MMRTTVAIDEQLAAELKRVAHESGKSFKQVVNDALRAGLRPAGLVSSRYRLKPASMGKPNPGFNLNKALDFQFVLTVAAYNLIRMRNLGVVPC